MYIHTYTYTCRKRGERRETAARSASLVAEWAQDPEVLYFNKSNIIQILYYIIVLYMIA